MENDPRLSNWHDATRPPAVAVTLLRALMARWDRRLEVWPGGVLHEAVQELEALCVAAGKP